MGFVVTFIRQILNCTVANFLVLSGSLCGKNIRARNANTSLLIKQIPKVKSLL